MRYFADPSAATVTYQMLFNGQDGDGVYAIGAASSTGGVTWTEYGSNPVLEKGGAGQWDDGHVKDPWLMWDGSQYVCYFSGYDGATYRIGRATASAYTGAWTKYGSNPVITLGSSGDFDDQNVSFPVVLYEPSDSGKEWKLWYTGQKASDGKWRIGYAHSTDGLSWTKFGQVVNVGSGGQWDDEGVVSAAIIKTGSTYNLFYGGTSVPTGTSLWQGGLVTFTDPEGTYTKSGSNPVLLCVNQSDASASQSLTADTNSGSAVVQVASTSHWVEGEPMMIAAGSVQSEYHTIASIDSGTQVTLNSAVTANFADADGALLRPFHYISVQPRTVLNVAAGGYQMFFAPFQPLADLSVAGEALWEGSMRATASALTSWTIDEENGLLFALSPANSGWHKFSAENPSVIVTPS